MLGVPISDDEGEIARELGASRMGPVVLGCISPRAVVVLFVKDEIAHPAQDEPLVCTGCVEDGLIVLATSVAGNAVFVKDSACFRTRSK